MSKQTKPKGEKAGIDPGVKHPDAYSKFSVLHSKINSHKVECGAVSARFMDVTMYIEINKGHLEAAAILLYIESDRCSSITLIITLLCLGHDVNTSLFPVLPGLRSAPTSPDTIRARG